MLREALAATYRNNPDIEAQRESLRADAELIPQALAAWFRPTVSATVTDERDRYHLRERTVEGSSNTLDNLHENITDGVAELDVSMDLYNGGSSSADVRYARATYAASRAVLASTEQSVLATAATHYLDVVQGQRLLEASQNHADELGQLKQRVTTLLANQRATVIDLEQVVNEIAVAEGSIASRQATLESARAAYEAVVGAAPGSLREWPELPATVSELDGAVETAQRENPRITAAQSEIDARRATVESERGALLPTLTVYGTATQELTHTGYTGTSVYTVHDRETGYTVGLELSIPLYDGGSQPSTVREKARLVAESQMKLASTQRSVEQDARSAWQRLQGAKRALDSAHAQLVSAEKVLTGRKREYRRRIITIDKLIDAEVAVNAAREAVVEQTYTRLAATVNLLKAEGRFDIATLGVPVKPVDVDVYRRRVEGDSWKPWKRFSD